MKIIWTRHARERQQQWEIKLSITRQEIEAVIIDPPQVMPGEASTLVAQARRGDGLLRVPFVQVGEDRRIVTVYWTSKVNKYWKGE